MPTDGLREARAYAYEIKCLVSSETGAVIRDWARRLSPDPLGAGAHGDEYWTTTIDFDNPDAERMSKPGGDPDAVLDRFRMARQLMSGGTAQNGMAIDVACHASLPAEAGAGEVVNALNRLDGVQSVMLQRTRSGDLDLRPCVRGRWTTLGGHS